MKADYARLLEAARKIKNWESAAEVATGLTSAGFSVSDQMMTNWKSRGISLNGKINAARILGVRLAWLDDRSGSMADEDAGLLDRGRARNDLRIEQSLAKHHFVRQRPSELAELTHIFNSLDDIGCGMVLQFARNTAKERGNDRERNSHA